MISFRFRRRKRIYVFKFDACYPSTHWDTHLTHEHINKPFFRSSREAFASDIVSLHLPLNDQTRHLVGDAFLAQVKPGAILVNCGRGALVDTDAVWRALTSGRLSGVGLDVFDPEPPAPHPLFSHPDVVLTPHLMGLSRRATAATFAAAAQGVLDVLGGREPQAVADPAWRTHAPKEIPV